MLNDFANWFSADPVTHMLYVTGGILVLVGVGGLLW